MTTTTAAPILPLPGEPQALKQVARALLEQAPATGLSLVSTGEWIVEPLWGRWSTTLEPRGMSRDSFTRIVAEYGNELRLWVVGERPWDHYVSGLSGRVARRLAPVPVDGGVDEAWAKALTRVGLTADASLETVTGRIGDLYLLHDLFSPRRRSGNGQGAYHAVVWAGARPRDPEVNVGEGHSTSAAAALAEALGRFLVRDPAYPPRRTFTPTAATFIGCPAPGLVR
jgi:hypothetical protein